MTYSAIYYFYIVACFEYSFSALTLLVGRQEGHPARKTSLYCQSGIGDILV